MDKPTHPIVRKMEKRRKRKAKMVVISTPREKNKNLFWRLYEKAYDSRH